jgi:hypothetical protein
MVDINYYNISVEKDVALDLYLKPEEVCSSPWHSCLFKASQRTVILGNEVLLLTDSGAQVRRLDPE